MVLDWNPVVARMAVPIILTTFLLNSLTLKDMGEFSKVLRKSDEVLSNARGEGNTTEEYDYIIIGAGSAGAILAKRLIESGEFTVLLLDRGGDPNPVSDLHFALGLVFQSDMIVNYNSVPQLRACLGNKGICTFPRGISLGGCSAVNALFYNRCNAKDYDEWANFTGDEIWNSESVTVAFKNIENYHGWYEDDPGNTHGTDGEMYVGKIEYLPGAETFYKAVAERGYPIGDINSLVSQNGFSKFDYNIKDGRRWGTYQAFIEPILGRLNLKIYRYSWVTKIHFDGSKHAEGVTYTRHGQTCYAKAKKEIILSAGAIESPKLLMLSGIGSDGHLKENGIDTVLDLPSVGANLQDHIRVRLPHFVLNTTFGEANYQTATNILEFITNGTGPYQSTAWDGGLLSRLSMGYLSSKMNKDPSWPDILINVVAQVSETEETLNAEVVLVKTQQTGTIRLASSDPEEDPLYNPLFFQDEKDAERLIDGIEEIVDFFLNSPTYKELGIKWSSNYANPVECDSLEFGTRDYWRCYVEIQSTADGHPTSTCRMGPDNLLAVVDSRLRVFGTTGLRVVDASVIPFVPNGNNNFPTIMVGEMGAKIILDQILIPNLSFSNKL